MAEAPKKPAPEKGTWDEIPMKNKRREGPTMKEKLLARRQAEAAAAKPEPAPEPEAPSKPEGRAKPARRAAAPKVSRRSASKPARASRAKSEGEDQDGEAESKPTGRSASRRSAGGSSSRKRPAKGGRKAGNASKGRGRGSAKDDKRSPIPILVGVVVLAGGGFGAWKFLGADGTDGAQADVVQAAEGDPVDATTGTQDGAETPSTDGAATASLAGGGPDSSTPETNDNPGDPGAGDTTPEGDATTPPADATETDPVASDAEPDPFAEAPAGSTPAATDPSSVDLTAYEDFGPLPETSAEDWAEIQGLAQTFLDPEAGAAGKRAERALAEFGKPAFPAVVNSLRAIDFSTTAGYRDGDIAQKLLMTIANGKNLGWKYSTEDKDVLYNKKVVRLWIQVWERSAESDKYWIEFTGLQPEEAEEDASGIDEAALDDLDDLDDL